MNILISYNWIKEYLKTDLSASEFAALTTNAGNSVEEMINPAQNMEHMVVGVVKELKSHPNADKLKIVITDIGSEEVEIVCGGVNLKNGQRVAVALPGTKVKWHGEGDLIELKETEIRGAKSHGMICAAEEIGFEKLPQGEMWIWDITSHTSAKAGTPLAKALELNDVIFDIEVTTNRPDCKSIIGQAREGVAVTGSEFAWEPIEIETDSTSKSLDVSVEDFDLCPHYQAIVIENVEVKPSPWWLQKRLLLAGFKPINNLVDITNYILHEYGQPLHTFDADKLEGEKIVVRKAKKGEKMVALDDVEYELSDSMLVIADDKKPVAIAGVMGGKATGTTEETQTVVIESATFNPVSIRKTSRALNLQSESQLLFEKGLSTESTGPALARAVELIQELAGGQVASEVYSVRKEDYKPLHFPFDTERARKLIGVDVSDEEMISILESLGFVAQKSGETYDIEVPYWRDHDIEHSVDFVEEIARVYGYDKLPSLLPVGELASSVAEPKLIWERFVKERLCGAGLTEVYSNSFVSAKQLERFGFNPEDAVLLKNPLSNDQSHMRPSLIPTMLTTIADNQRVFTSEQLFEIAPVYLKRKDDIPEQSLRCLMAFYGESGEDLFFKAKGMLARLFRETHISEWSIARSEALKTWHPMQSVEVTVNGEVVGVIGAVHPELVQSFGVEQDLVLIDLDFESLTHQFSNKLVHTPLPAFQDMKRDLAFIVDGKTEYESMATALQKADELISEIDLFDVYAGKGVPDGKKSLAIHISFRAPDRTLSSDEADAVMLKLRNVIENDFGGIIRE